MWKCFLVRLAASLSFDKAAYSGLLNFVQRVLKGHVSVSHKNFHKTYTVLKIRGDMDGKAVRTFLSNSFHRVNAFVDSFQLLGNRQIAM